MYNILQINTLVLYRNHFTFTFSSYRQMFHKSPHFQYVCEITATATIIIVKQEKCCLLSSHYHTALMYKSLGTENFQNKAKHKMIQYRSYNKLLVLWAKCVVSPCSHISTYPAGSTLECPRCSPVPNGSWYPVNKQLKKFEWM